MIQVQCGGCGKLYKVSDQFAGKKTRCKSCSAVIEIPAAGVPEPQPAEAAPAGAEASEKRRAYGKPKFPSGKKFAKPAVKGVAGKVVPTKGLGAKRFAAAKKTLGSARPAPAEPGAERPRKSWILIGGGVALVLLAAVAALFVSGVLGGGRAAGPRTTAKAPRAAKEAALEGETEAGSAELAPVPGDAAGGSGRDDALSLIPARASALVHAAFGRLQNAPGIGEAIAEALKEEEVAGLLDATGFDPIASLSTIWFASDVQVSGSGSAETWIAVLEGVFEKEAIVQGLKAQSLIARGARDVGGVEVYPLEVSKFAGGEPAECYIAFLSENRLLVGEAELFNEALRLRAGGESVRANKVLASLSGDFGTEKVLWAAAKATDAVKAMLQGAGLGMPGASPPGAAEPEEAEEEPAEPEEAEEEPAEPEEAAPSVEGFFVSLDALLDGSVVLELSVRGASAAEGEKIQKFAGPRLALLKLQAPPDLEPLLDAIKMQRAAETVRFQATLSEALVEKLRTLLPFAGAGPEGEEPSEGTPPEEESGESAEGEEEAEG